MTDTLMIDRKSVGHLEIMPRSEITLEDIYAVIEHKQPRNPVDTAVSDLFFNYDLSGAKERDDDGDMVWNIESLLAEAETVLASCKSLAPQIATTPVELVLDFFERM